MIPPPRRRSPSPRWVGALVSVVVGVVACANHPGVRTESADTRAGIEPSAAPRPAPTAPDPSPATTDLTPAFTLPNLTLPEREPAPDTRPDTQSVPPSVPATTEDVTAPVEDRAASGDSMYPAVGNDGVDVTHYLVRLTYHPDTAVIEGVVTITAQGLRDLDVVVFDAVGLDIAGVTIEGAPAAFDVTDDELVIDQPLARREEVEVTITYSAAPTAVDGALGFEVGWFATPTGSYVLNEPNGLRLWMPADDHPADKATWRFELTVPDGLAGIANGEQLASVDAGPDTTWIWEQREPMATYLVQLLTGDYQVVDGGTVGSIPIVHVALTDDIEQMQPYFDTVGPQLEFFESVFGPYPLDRYGLAFTESYAGLAMETQGRSMFSAEDFPGTTGSISDDEDLLLSHELAHQWFGDAVTPADWGDLWLNESFATYGQWLWFDHAGTSSVEDSATGALVARQRPTEPTGTPTLDNLFGIERYDGGAVVLHALRREVGDDAFFTTLRRWAADHDGESRSTEDFIALAEDVADRPLTAFFETWLFSDRLPAAFPP